MKDINQYRNILIVIAILVVAIFVSRNIYKDFTTQKKTIEKETEDLEEGKITIEQWRRKVAEYKDLKEEFFQGSLLDVKKFIEDTAQSTEVVINSLNQSESQTDYFQVGEFNLNINCTYRQLIRFIRLLEKKAVEVTNLSIDQTSRSQDQLSVDISIKGVVLK